MKINNWIPFDRQSVVSDKRRYSVARLAKLAEGLPVMEIPIDHLYIDYDFDEMNLRTFVMHMTAVLDADLDYPIILDECGGLLDGRHRVMKALYEGRPTIKAVRFETNPSPCEIEREE